MQAMTTKARRVAEHAAYSFLFGSKEASADEESRGIRQRFPYRCNKTKTSRTEVTVEPKKVSPPEPLAGKDYVCQDSLY